MLYARPAPMRDGLSMKGQDLGFAVYIADSPFFYCGARSSTRVDGFAAWRFDSV